MFYSRKKVLLAACVALAVLHMSAVAEEKSDRLTASDVFNLQYAVDPQISPDGRRIVYVREFSDMLSDRRCSNLWVINFDGADNRPLTTGTHSDTSPRWSPDGTRIAFLSDQDGKSQIYVRWMDTGQTAKITSLQQPPSGIAEPARGACWREVGRSSEGLRQADLSLQRPGLPRAGLHAALCGFGRWRRAAADL